MTASRFVKTGVVLPVTDIYDTVAWYERVFGFKTNYIHGNGRRGENPNFANYAIMSRDDIEVSFIMDEGGDPVWTRAGTGYLPITVTDVDAVYADVQSKKIPLARGLQKENWPARGFVLKDPSGNEIRISQPV